LARWTMHWAVAAATTDIVVVQHMYHLSHPFRDSEWGSLKPLFVRLRIKHG
jgi:hypothetical protein